MAASDLELALRAVERQAAAMQAIERKIAALYLFKRDDEYIVKLRARSNKDPRGSWIEIPIKRGSARDEWQGPILDSQNLDGLLRAVTAFADCEASPSGFAREILARPDREQILTKMEKAHASLAL